MTEEQRPKVEGLPTLSEAVSQWGQGKNVGVDALAELQAALMEREDQIVGHLHMAGMQFGLYPQIIAEVLATVGLGTPPTVEGRALIRQQFVSLMEELRRQQGPG